MSAKIVLIVVGAILLLLGIALLAAAMHPDWENKEYKNLRHKDAPENLKKHSQIIGGILTAAGLGLLVWGIMIHTKMVKSLH